jgi:hypothetical protein
MTHNGIIIGISSWVAIQGIDFGKITIEGGCMDLLPENHY